MSRSDHYAPCIKCGVNQTGHGSGKCAECRTVKCRCGAVYVAQVNITACSDCMKVSWVARQRRQRNKSLFGAEYLVGGA